MKWLLERRMAPEHGQFMEMILHYPS